MKSFSFPKGDLYVNTSMNVSGMSVGFEQLAESFQKLGEVMSVTFTPVFTPVPERFPYGECFKEPISIPVVSNRKRAVAVRKTP